MLGDWRLRGSEFRVIVPLKIEYGGSCYHIPRAMFYLLKGDYMILVQSGQTLL